MSLAILNVDGTWWDGSKWTPTRNEREAYKSADDLPLVLKSGVNRPELYSRHGELFYLYPGYYPVAKVVDDD